jgi:hypothetical protein
MSAAPTHAELTTPTTVAPARGGTWRDTRDRAWGSPQLREQGLGDLVRGRRFRVDHVPDRLLRKAEPVALAATPFVLAPPGERRAVSRGPLGAA